MVRHAGNLDGSSPRCHPLRRTAGVAEVGAELDNQDPKADSSNSLLASGSTESAFYKRPAYLQVPISYGLSLSNSARPVDARWRLANHIAYGQLEAKGFGWDTWVEQGVGYLMALLHCQTEADRDNLALEMPDLHAACLLHHSSDKLARGTLEGRLLAGQSVEEVGVACNLTAMTVTVYEALFFAVVGKLEAREYILIETFGRKMWKGEVTEDDSDIMLMYVGFTKGPIFLEALLRYFRSGLVVPERLEACSKAQLQDLDLMLTMRLVVLAMVLPWEKCGRVFVMIQVQDRLKALIQAWPDDDLAIPQVDLGNVPVEDREAWWQAWRTVTQACTASDPVAANVA